MVVLAPGHALKTSLLWGLTPASRFQLYLRCLVLDPAADEGCRVWVQCPECDSPEPAYLLGYDGGNVFCQCECEHRWWHDTGFGVGDRPQFPEPDWFAA